jgi:hypothetical protein
MWFYDILQFTSLIKKNNIWEGVLLFMLSVTVVTLANLLIWSLWSLTFPGVVEFTLGSGRVSVHTFKSCMPCLYVLQCDVVMLSLFFFYPLLINQQISNEGLNQQQKKQQEICEPMLTSNTPALRWIYCPYVNVFYIWTNASWHWIHTKMNPTMWHAKSLRVLKFQASVMSTGSC